MRKEVRFELAESKKKNDFATWLRLLRYLRGSRSIVVVVFVCIAIEALFTVTTISSLKPVLNMIMHNRFVDISTEPRLEVEMKKAAADVVVVKAFGEAAGPKSATKLRNAIADAVALKPAKVVADFAALPGISTFVKTETFYARVIAEEKNIPITVILPAQGVPGDTLGVSSSALFTAVDPGSDAAAQLQAQYAGKFTPPKSLEKKEPTWLDNAKASVVGRFMPMIERVQIYSQQSRENKFRVLTWIICWMLFSALVMVSASIGVGYFSGFLAMRVVQKLRNHVYSHMLTLDLRYFTSNSPGSNMSIVLQDVNAVDGAIDILFSSVIKTPITVLVLVAAMFTISPSLTLYSFLVLPFIGFILYVLGKRVRRVSVRVQKVRAMLASILEETFSGMRVVKAFNMEEREAGRFYGDSQKILRMSMRTKAAEEVGTGLTQLLGIITISLMVLGGGYQIIMTEKMSAPDFVLFVGFLTQVFRPLKGISKTNSRIQRGLAGCDRVFGVLDTKPNIADRPNAVPVKRLQKQIEFENVAFTYTQGRPPVLKDINLTIPAGKSIALVGETGSGKSTLVNLLPRFYDPTEGRILYDGVDLRDVQLQSLREQIAIITQDVILFDDTIAKNIAYGSLNPVPLERIEEAARAANAHEFISRKPDGYDTMIGSKGVRLSGGERQRIAIARAIVKDSPILILDEATSALDSETEALIQEALNRLIKNRTVLVIAHRLSTIQSCDEIYVMDGGRFVEYGTHDELLQRGGRYARFHAIQFGTVMAAAGS